MTTQDIRFLNASTNTASTAPKASAKATAAAAAPAPQDTVSLSGKTAAKPDSAAPGKPQYVPGQVIVKFKPGLAKVDVGTLAEAQGLKTIRHFDVPPQMVQSFGGELYHFKLKSGDSVEKAIARLSGQPGVAYAEPNYKVQLNDPPATGAARSAVKNAVGAKEGPSDVVPNDLDKKLWGLHNTGQDGGRAGVDIGATKAWATTTGNPNGKGPLIAIIDTGMDYNHPDLAANAWVNPNEIPNNGKDDDNDGIIDDIHGANMITKSGDPMDDNEHGSHVAGTIGAVGNNGVGVVGVNWNATIAAVKFLDSGGGGTYADAVDAVLYSGKIGARLTSNSWGGGGYSKALEDAFRASPAIHICAAGNDSADNDTNPSYPAGFRLPNIVAVAAHDRNDQLADFSNIGAKTVHVAAPGVDIYSCKPDNQYQFLSGTSMATPHVSGVVGLMLAKDSTLTNDQIKARLVNTATKAPAYKGKVISNGRVNAANALKEDLVPPATPTDFKVKAAGASSMTVGWTEVGDDGMDGKASAYEIRYSDKPISLKGDDNSISWDEATPVAGLGEPGDPGTAEEVDIKISPEDTPRQYFFGLRVSDGVGNQSGIATASATSVAAAVAFKDDMDTDNDNWAPQGGWAKVDEPGRGKVYTDSPNGPYPDNANTWILSKPIDLSGVKNPQLLYDEKHDTEKNYDFVHVEVTKDGGENFDELEKYDGTQDWNTHSVDLKAYEGKSIQLRFRMTSDGSIDKDGVYLDNVKIAGDPPGKKVKA